MLKSKSALRVDHDSIIQHGVYLKDKYPYESAFCYGMGNEIRKMAFLPSFLPLAIETDHGPSQRDEPTVLEYKSNIIFYHSKRLSDIFKEKTLRQSETYLSPFTFHRKRYAKKYTSLNRKGTISFPAHSTDLIDSTFDVLGYVKKLKELPEEYQPVDVCLYYKDIELGRHHLFLDNGFKVYCAGHIYDTSFISNFYSIIKDYKYSTSNTIGSYLFYSVDFKIPFFIYGDSPVYDNHSLDPNSEKGVYNPYFLYKQMSFVYHLFTTDLKTNPVTISKHQKEVVEFELGITHFSRIKFILQIHKICWGFTLREFLYVAKKRFTQFNIIKIIVIVFSYKT